MTVDGAMAWAVQTGSVVTILLIVILLIRRPFARAFGANAAYALWALPIIRLILPGLSVPESWLPAIFRRSSPEVPAMGTPAIGTSEFPSESLTGFSELAALRPRDFPVAQAESAISWTPLILTIWLSVAVAWFVLQMVRQARFMAGIKRSSEAAASELTREARRAADRAGLTNVPDLRISERDIGPFVTGVIRPTVIVPAAFFRDYTADQRHYALVHEFAHVKRRDLWAAFAALVFRAVNWFNPVVHYAAHKMRVDQEAACDAFVIARTQGEGGNRSDYAKTLLQAARTGRSSVTNAGLALSLMEDDIKETET